MLLRTECADGIGRVIDGCGTDKAAKKKHPTRSYLTALGTGAKYCI